MSPSPDDPGFWGEREHLDWKMNVWTPSLYSGGSLPCASVYTSVGDCPIPNCLDQSFKNTNCCQRRGHRYYDSYM